MINTIPQICIYFMEYYSMEYCFRKDCIRVQKRPLLLHNLHIREQRNHDNNDNQNLFGFFFFFFSKLKLYKSWFDELSVLV